MLLLDRNGAKDDIWERSEYLCQAESDHVLAPFGAIAGAAVIEDHLKLGALLEPNRTVEDVAPFFDRLDLIVIHFPSATNGRGFSTARQLRRAGFKGVLRAFGPLIADQFPQALDCGFDEVEIIGESSRRQPPQQWLDALAAISRRYQRDYGATESIFDRRAALAEATNV